MKNSVILTISSLLSVLLFTLHVADDMARGLDSVGIQNLIGVTFMAVWVYAALFLAERRSGQIILLVLAVLCVGVCGLHMSAPSGRVIARSSGGFFFIWTLFALGTTALLSMILAVRGLWGLRRSQPR